MPVNNFGRPWEEFDSVRAQANIPGPFTLTDRDGTPLCGRVVEDAESVIYHTPNVRTKP